MAFGRVVIVTGVAGVGKTTVLQELIKLLGEAGTNVSVINFASVMLEIAMRGGKVFHRDELRHKPIEMQRDLQSRAAEEIAKMAEGTPLTIVDTHMIIRTESGYWAGLPANVLEKLKPSLFVLIEAEPREVLARRVGDKTRQRDRALTKEIIEEFECSRSMASSCSVLTGAPFRILKNPGGKQVEAAKELLKLLGEVGGP